MNVIYWSCLNHSSDLSQVLLCGKKITPNYMLWNPLEKNQISSGKRLYSNSIF